MSVCENASPSCIETSRRCWSGGAARVDAQVHRGVVAELYRKRYNAKNAGKSPHAHHRGSCDPRLHARWISEDETGNPARGSYGLFALPAADFADAVGEQELDGTRVWHGPKSEKVRSTNPFDLLFGSEDEETGSEDAASGESDDTSGDESPQGAPVRHKPLSDTPATEMIPIGTVLGLTLPLTLYFAHAVRSCLFTPASKSCMSYLFSVHCLCSRGVLW